MNEVNMINIGFEFFKSFTGLFELRNNFKEAEHSNKLL